VCGKPGTSPSDYRKPRPVQFYRCEAARPHHHALCDECSYTMAKGIAFVLVNNRIVICPWSDQGKAQMVVIALSPKVEPF
jgi:hypothetical protein